MKRAMGISLLMLVSIAVVAVEHSQVEYVGGTIQSVKAGAVGELDTASDTILSFQYSGGSLPISYAAIESYEYTQELAHHLGVAPAIAVGLVRKRQRRHFFRISYKDQANVSQVVVFEVPKQTPNTLLAVLQTRAPQGCKPRAVCTQRFY